MSRIRVVLDPRAEALLQGDGVIRVTDEASYWQARRVLRSRLEQDSDLLIWVTAPTFLNRFDDLRALDGVEVVQFDSRRELARMLGYSELPPLLTDEIIQYLGLQRRAQAAPPDAGDSPITWVLRVVLGDEWACPRPGDADVSQILHSLADSNAVPQVIIPLISARMFEWMATEPFGSLWRWLAMDPLPRARSYVHVYATCGYGDAASQWLQQEGITPDEAAEVAQRIPTDELRLSISARLFSRRLRQLIEKRLADSLANNGILALDAVMAGIPEEMSQVTQYLLHNAGAGKALTTTDITHLTNLVSRLPDSRDTRHITRIASWLAEHPLPSLLDTDATWPQAEYWLENEYLPAYVSYCLTGRIAATEDVAISFEAWLISGYQALVGEGRVGLHTFACGVPRAHTQQVVLVILLDGAPAFLVRAFKEELFQHCPLSLARDGLMISLLPTRTAQNRRSLLSGRLPDQASAADVNDLAGLFGAGAQSARVVSELKDIKTLKPGEVIFYHCRTIDEDWLHKPHDPLSRWLGAAEALDELRGQLKDVVALAIEADTDLLIGCVSDHGWSEVPRNAVLLRVPDELADRVSHCRVLDGQLESGLGNPLERHRYYLEDDCTIASGYSVLGRRPQGAVHGGATPQESVVYGFWASTSRVSLADDLGFEISGTIRRAVATNPLQINICNPNPESVTVLDVALAGLSLATGILPFTIEAGGTQQVAANCNCPGQDRSILLRGAIEWTPRDGARQRQVVEITLTTVGAAESDQAFEDMFEK